MDDKKKLEEYKELNTELSISLSQNIDLIPTKIAEKRKKFKESNAIDVSHLESSCELYISNYYFAKGEVEACLKHANLCFEYSIQSDLPTVIWNAYHLFSHWYVMLGEFDKAIFYCLKEINILDKIGSFKNIFLCHSKIRLAEIYITAYRPRKGLKYLDEALALSASLNEANRAIIMQLEMDFRIDCWESIGKYKNIIGKCLEIQKFEMLNDAKIFTGLHLANSYLYTQDFKRAEHYLSYVQEFINLGGTEADKIKAEIIEIQLAVVKGKIEKLNYLEKFTKEIPNRFSGSKDTLLINKSMRMAYKALAFVYEQVGDMHKVLEFERKIKQIESIGLEENIEILEDLRMALEKNVQTKKISKEDFIKLELFVGTHLLSPREREVAWYVREGLPNKEIADKLNITEKSVNESKRRISHKLNIKGRGMLRSSLLKIE